MKKTKLLMIPAALAVCGGIAMLTTSLSAAPEIPPNLANGLDELVSSNIALRQAAESRQKIETFTSADGKAYASERAAEYASDALTDEAGARILVRAHLNGLVSLDDASKAIAARVPSFETVAVDRTYKGGVIEGYIAIEDVPALAYATGVRSVALEHRPELNRAIAPEVGKKAEPQASPGQTLNKLGTAFDQGVVQHRVDQINKFYNPGATSDFEGSGISVGFISDSFNHLTTTTFATDVANFDLPGASNNPVNTQPVVVLQDHNTSTDTDEGRGMGQIIYKMAPKARIAFATGNGGAVNFANNIRALAGLPGYTYDPSIQQGFAADAICDDLGYGDEPFFEDGIVANAVDDVAAAGVSYFSSAGNDIGTYDYDSDYRNVANGTGLTASTNNALVGTNINLANVPTALYQGGFHNFNPDGQDVAQTVNVLAGTALPVTNFQWDDPYNQTVPVIQPAIYHSSGVHNGSTTQNYTLPSLTAGSKYVLNVTAQPGSSFDAIVTLKDPNGTTIIDHQDTGTDETLQFTANLSGNYTASVDSFAATTGAYNVDLYFAAPNPGVTTDFNLLVFDLSGNYLPNSSLKTNNISSNVPYESGRTSPKSGELQVQYVIARSAVPTATNPATHIRWIIRGNGAAGIGPAEYITYNTPNTKGHAMANGCNGVAAYSVFRPSIPEYFTSPGPATVYFDRTGNRLNPPEVRLQPGVAAADNANTSFFNADNGSDIDTNTNFSGTSAAAPHAVAIAALVLQAHGGRGSVTPAQMKNLLHRSTFQHDLDPNSATGVARTSLGGKVTITANSDRGLNPSAGAFNPNSITVGYVGPGTLTNLVFNPEGTAATGGAPNAGNNGVDANNAYFSNIYPGVVFQPLPGTATMFVFGNASRGLTSADVVPTFTNLAPAPSNGTNQYWTMTLSFPTQQFVGGDLLRFTTGHAQQHDSTVTSGFGPTGGVTGVNTTQADLFGGGVQIPEGTLSTNGMTFSGTTSGGGTFNGRMQNRIGNGYSVTDGFGFLNAELAVTQPVQ